MKKYSVLLLIVALAACNDNSKTADAAGEKKDAATEKKAVSTENSGGCNNLILFHKGAVIEGKSYDAAGKEQGGQVTTITDVKNDGNETIAAAKLDMRSVINGKEYSKSMNVAYKCNGKALYVDLTELLANFSALKDAKVEANSLEFPLQLSDGQILPDASVNVEMSRAGMDMKTTSSYTHRKVEATENITTPAGNWNCYKISSTIETSVNFGGAAGQKIAEAMKQKMPPVKMIMWFAPGFGLVKTETYSGDKLSNHSEIVSFKN